VAEIAPELLSVGSVHSRDITISPPYPTPYAICALSDGYDTPFWSDSTAVIDVYAVCIQELVPSQFSEMQRYYLLVPIVNWHFTIGILYVHL
jgi:hypothetical protein